MAGKRQIPETLFDDLGFRMTYEAKRVIYEAQTEHQHLVLFEHSFFGKILMLDGATQVTTADEFVYHEMMTHVPILAHGNAREVLIVGGGDCGIAEEVLKHNAVKRLTQVEIDASVVEFSKEHFPEFTKPVLADNRFDLIIADGMKYVAKTDRRFDVIIVNSTDPHGPGKVLFSQKFYAACRRCMTAGAVMVTQNGVPMFQSGELTSAVVKRAQVCSPTAIAISRRSRPMSGAIWPWGGPPMTPGCVRFRSRPSPSATARLAASRPNIGLRRCTWRHSRCPVSLPRTLRKQIGGSRGCAVHEV